MISAFNHRLLLIERSLASNGAVLAQLHLVDADSTPGVEVPAHRFEHQLDSDRLELDTLTEWVRRLRVQVARIERRIERLRAIFERHDSQLSDIKSRIVWSSGGCAVVRSPTAWDSTCSRDAQRHLAPVGGPTDGNWPPLLKSSHSKQPSSRAMGGVLPLSEGCPVVVDASGVAPQQSQSFTSLQPGEHH